MFSHLHISVQLNRPLVCFTPWCNSFGQVWTQKSHSGVYQNNTFGRRWHRSGPKWTPEWFLCGWNAIQPWSDPTTRCTERLVAQALLFCSVWSRRHFQHLSSACIRHHAGRVLPDILPRYHNYEQMPTVRLSHVISHSNVSLTEICAWLEHRTFFLCLISCSHIRHIWPISWVNIFICFVLMHFGLLEFFSMWIGTKPWRKIHWILITNSPPDLNKSKWMIGVKMSWIFREVTGMYMHLETVGYPFFYWQ